ncbi:hypothetical protein RJ639_015805 [Escallonia herrerae]|uniref:UBA domain-containing protein n=1 Tax=Escallonia herrerae TaxID=1293975 RepID=A0AA88VFA1_9ASTE|nr:hypothetical protein RJ639_015805 [Escallonia herrerae]
MAARTWKQGMPELGKWKDKRGWRRKKMEMQQFLSMGFPNELASQALAATDGKSSVKATEWILNHKSLPPDPTPAQNLVPHNPSLTPSQSKINHFFHFQSSKK